MHPHSHEPATGNVLRWSLAATTAFIIVEIAAGLHAGSLALLSDAGHNFTDALALLLAWFGFFVAAKPADEIKTYGYHRAGVLAAFVNALALVALSLWIFRESYLRLRSPEPVKELTMILVAGLGLVLNAAIMWGLRSARRHDINVRSAFLHMLGDALGSIAIIIGALVIRSTGWYWVDPVLSFIIGALIIWTAWDIIKEALNILLEGLPQGLDLKTVGAAIRDVEGVLDVHHLHIWSLGSSTHALSCHVLIEDLPPSVSNVILARVKCVLAERFHIHHSTIQFEHSGCDVPECDCAIAAESRRPEAW